MGQFELERWVNYVRLNNFTVTEKLVAATAGIENLVVQAAINKSREDGYHAVMMDPLCSALCNLQEIREMCDLILLKNKEFLGYYS
jgi:alpha-galactosidase/6-phospho-beta-glucosidase family protein